MQKQYKLVGNKSIRAAITLSDVRYICIINPSGNVVLKDANDNVKEFESLNDFMASDDNLYSMLSTIRCTNGVVESTLDKYIVECDDSTSNETDNSTIASNMFNEPEMIRAMAEAEKQITTRKALESIANSLSNLEVAVKKNKTTVTDSTEDMVEEGEYTLDDFNNAVTLPNRDTAEKLETILRMKGALLLTSAPGNGKTTAAVNLAKLIVGYNKSYRIKKLQFNQSTSYADFIEGFRSTTNGFELIDGEFKKFCDGANRDDKNIPYVCIIDEINRANTASVLGEALNAIENRGEYITTNNGSKFCIPENVYIIATMNAIDNSAITLDDALLSRFARYEMDCGNTITSDDIIRIRTTAGLYVDEYINQSIKLVLDSIYKINDYLSNKRLRGRNNKIGIRPLFTQYTTVMAMIYMVETDIMPVVNDLKIGLDEDNCKKIDTELKNLKKSIMENYIEA